MHAQADVRALGEGEVPRRIVSALAETVGIREDVGIPIRPCDRDSDELALPDGRRAEHDVACRVAVDHRRGRLHPERLFDSVPSQQRVVRDEIAHDGALQDVLDRVRNHPLGRLDPAEEQHRGIRDNVCPRQATGVTRSRGNKRGRGIVVECGLDCSTKLSKGTRARTVDRLAGRDACHLGDNRVVPGKSVGWVGLVEPECVHHRNDGQWPGHGSPELGSAVRLDRVDQGVSLALDRVRKSVAHGIEAKRSREGPAVARVLDAVE